MSKTLEDAQRCVNMCPKCFGALELRYFDDGKGDDDRWLNRNCPACGYKDSAYPGDHERAGEVCDWFHSS